MCRWELGVGTTIDLKRRSVEVELEYILPLPMPMPMPNPTAACLHTLLP
jgi:hypothetical protein